MGQVLEWTSVNTGGVAEGREPCVVVSGRGLSMYIAGTCKRRMDGHLLGRGVEWQRIERRQRYGG